MTSTFEKKRPLENAFDKLNGKQSKVSDWPIDLNGKTEFENEFIHYIPGVMSTDASEKLRKQLKTLHNFTQDKIIVNNRVCLIHRTQVLLSKKAGVRYRYAGADIFSEAWSDEMDALCKELSTRFNIPLNSALVNRYKNGKECVGRHADNEADMEHDVIVTISLGVPRLLRVTGKENANDKRLQIALQGGSVFVQKRGAQKVVKHEIPVQATVLGERISLTFRQLKLPSEIVQKEENDAEPEEFYFDMDSDEYGKVKQLALDWCVAKGITDFGNYDYGEQCSKEFETFVKEKHADVADLVKRDVMIYQAVLENLFC